MQNHKCLTWPLFDYFLLWKPQHQKLFCRCSTVGFQLPKASTLLSKPANLFLNAGLILPISQLSVQFIRTCSLITASKRQVNDCRNFCLVQSRVPQMWSYSIVGTGHAKCKPALCFLNQGSIALMDPYDDSDKRNGPGDLSALWSFILPL